MKTLQLLLFFPLSFCIHAQTQDDLFEPSEVDFWWLGVDFSHVKLIGDFAQFAEAGKKSEETIRDLYFPGWNEVVLEDRDKYNVAAMIQKSEINYDPKEVQKLNATTTLESLTGYNNPNYNRDSIARFISKYQTENRSGIGLVFIAEALNKSAGQGVFHFVAFNRSNSEILIHERIVSIPVGVGLRNYWAGAIYRTICEIRDTYFKSWKKAWKKSKE